MPVWLADLLFWIIALVVLFFLIRWLQGRKKNKDE